MESLLAIGVGLVLRIVVDIATDNDDRVGGVLVGLWEGVVLNHFVRRMPHSFDPYLGFGFRIFVDFLFTQSFSRLALVALWALVSMLLADIAPNIWHDSGLRHLYRQVRKDVRNVKRAVPHIRIKNDLPSVRLFNQPRSTSSEVAGSIRSDRAVPSRSPAPSPTPTPGPARRPGRSPPGTLPDVSGWSETATDLSSPRERVVTSPGPSPVLIPSREDITYAHIDATRVTTSQTWTIGVQDTSIATRRAQNESVLLSTPIDTAVVGATTIEPIDDPSRHDPPTIPDDWVDVGISVPAQPDEPVAPFQPDPSTPSTPTQSRPLSIFDPSQGINVSLNVPDGGPINRGSQPPDQVPLPESRAASVIGGVYDQPRPRGTSRDRHRPHVDKATSEVGAGSSKSFIPLVTTETKKSWSMSRSRAEFTAYEGSRLKHPIHVDVGPPEVPPKETQAEVTNQGKLDVSDAGQGPEPQLPTPAQVDCPANVLNQPKDTPPMFRPAKQQQEQPQSGEPDRIPSPSVGANTSPTPLQAKADKGSTVEPNKALFDVSSPSRTPPPPFTEFSGIPGDSTNEGALAEQNPVTQGEMPVELTAEQKVAEGKRRAFLLFQVQELETSRVDLQRRLDKEDDPESYPARAIESDIKETEKTLMDAKARIAKTQFSEPPPDPPTRDVSLENKTVAEVQFAITSAVLNELLARNDAGPMTVRATINRQKSLKGKAKEAREALMAFGKLHQFATRWEAATPGILNVTF